MGSGAGVAVCLVTATSVGVTVVAVVVSGVAVDRDHGVGIAVAVGDASDVSRSETSVDAAVVPAEPPLRQMITMVRIDSSLPNDVTQALSR